MIRSRRLSVPLILWICGVTATAAADGECPHRLPVDKAHSTLGFVATQAGADFQGRFREFTADICFSPEEPRSSRFEIIVSPGSVDTRNSERDEILRGHDFFAVDEFPVSRFVADEFQGGPQRFVAIGRLTLRGVTAPLTLPFEFRAPSRERPGRLEGDVILSRLAFGVGQGDWQDTTWVGDEVRVKFSLTLGLSATPDGVPESRD